MPRRLRPLYGCLAFSSSNGAFAARVKQRYRARNAIERCFGRLKPLRRIAIRYDRKAAHFVAFLCLAASRLWSSD